MKLETLARVCGAQLEGDGNAEVRDVASLGQAGPEQLTFVSRRKYLPLLDKSRPGAVIAAPDFPIPSGLNVLRHKDPDYAFSLALDALRPAPPRPAPGVSPQAVIGRDVVIGQGVHVGPLAVVSDGARLGDNAIVHAQCYVGENVEIGNDTVLLPQSVVLPGCTIGARCLVHPGVVIGSDGFGFHFVQGRFAKAPQRGRVAIGNDVELGANTAIDRARIDVTRIGDGTKVDNLCQIAHNVQIGQHCALAGQAGIAGSTVLQDYVLLGGAAGIVDHIHVGMGAQIAAKSGIIEDVPPGARMAGAPAVEAGLEMRREIASRKLPEALKRLKRLEKQVHELLQRAGDGQ
jgi:UDP-3-O-[3-hydroxymyristoyl] glucosamine N-acyltransferase